MRLLAMAFVVLLLVPSPASSSTATRTETHSYDNSHNLDFTADPRDCHWDPVEEGVLPQNCEGEFLIPDTREQLECEGRMLFDEFNAVGECFDIEPGDAQVVFDVRSDVWSSARGLSCCIDVFAFSEQFDSNGISLDGSYREFCGRGTVPIVPNAVVIIVGTDALQTGMGLFDCHSAQDDRGTVTATFYGADVFSDPTEIVLLDATFAQAEAAAVQSSVYGQTGRLADDPTMRTFTVDLAQTVDQLVFDVTWGNEANDFDLFLTDPNGDFDSRGGATGSFGERVAIDAPVLGRYRIDIAPFVVTEADNVHVVVRAIAGPTPPPPPPPPAIESILVNDTFVMQPGASFYALASVVVVGEPRVIADPTAKTYEVSVPATARELRFDLDWEDAAQRMYFAIEEPGGRYSMHHGQQEASAGEQHIVLKPVEAGDWTVDVLPFQVTEATEVRIVVTLVE